MKKLNKMIIREVFKSKGQFIAAAAVIFAGITMFSASYMSYQNLKNSVTRYYEQYSFLDYYAELQGISPEGVKAVKAFKGVKDAIGRVSADVGADMGKNKLSILAPIGAALLGYRVGDVIEWPVPSGTKSLRIEEIIYQPEAAGDLHL